MAKLVKQFVVSHQETVVDNAASHFIQRSIDKIWQGLFTEVLAQYKPPEPYLLLVNIDQAASIKASLAQFFKERCRTRVHDQGNQGCLIVNTVTGVIGSDEKLATDMETLRLSSIELFENLLNQAISQNELPTGYQVQVSAKSLVAFNMGLNNLSKIIRDEQQLWEVCENFLVTHQLA